MANSAELSQALTLLYATYGRPEVDRERDDILGSLIAAILSQATHWQNASRAFGTLMERFEGQWHQIAHAQTSEVAEAIAIGGLSKQKAPRIQALLVQVKQAEGQYDLERVHQLPPAKAYALLCGLPGVGPGTAAFVLMRAAKMPLFAMNTGIHRVCKRLGWTAKGGALAQAQLSECMPEGEHDAAHQVLNLHGQEVCRPKVPACEECVLGAMCPKVGVVWPRE